MADAIDSVDFHTKFFSLEQHWENFYPRFCGVLISFHEVMKLQNFEFDVRDAIPSDAQNIPALVFFACFWMMKLRLDVSELHKWRHPRE